jgi:type II secretory pathway component PulF
MVLLSSTTYPAVVLITLNTSDPVLTPMLLYPRKQAATSSSMQKLKLPTGMLAGAADTLATLLTLLVALLLMFLVTFWACVLLRAGLVATTLGVGVGVTTLGV